MTTVAIQILDVAHVQNYKNLQKAKVSRYLFTFIDVIFAKQ